jgi:hypothetical protein
MVAENEFRESACNKQKLKLRKLFTLFFFFFLKKKKKELFQGIKEDFSSQLKMLSILPWFSVVSKKIKIKIC